MKSLLLLLSILALAGCVRMPTHVADLIRAQAPGSATGAGATLIGPANSAAPSVQEAERTVEYFADLISAPDTASADLATPKTPPSISAESGAAAANPAEAAARTATPEAAPHTIVSRPRYVHEKVTTTIGQHQAAAPLIQAASAASGWPATRWLGWLCIIVGLGGWIHGVTHKETGYPLVFLKVAGCGVFFVLIGENPVWLLMLLLPLGFYAVQKFNLLRPLP